ncbi:MAG TPA: NUDIX hydrolase [Solirubrobacterales bacterium]|nr:NUDIX hydrolase [Solirubrobacterales bacterium]
MEARRRGPAEAPNDGEPATPRPAASVVLLRHGGRHQDRGLEVLLLRRTQEARFMPGVWVFPGGSVDPCDGEGEACYSACAVRELKEEAGIELPADSELVLFSRWITPEIISTRFDAWFFLALAPPHAEPQPDGVETNEGNWYSPEVALRALETGGMAIAFPTIRQLQALREFGSAEEAIAAHREATVEPILPKLTGEGEEQRLALPGDPDYPA